MTVEKGMSSGRRVTRFGFNTVTGGVGLRAASDATEAVPTSTLVALAAFRASTAWG